MDLTTVLSTLPAQYTAVVAVDIALVQVIKSVIPDNMQTKVNRFYPVCSLVIGFLLGLGLHFSWWEALSTGFAAMGAYRGVKVTAFRA